MSSASCLPCDRVNKLNHNSCVIIVLSSFLLVIIASIPRYLHSDLNIPEKDAYNFQQYRGADISLVAFSVGAPLLVDVLVNIYLSKDFSLPQLMLIMSLMISGGMIYFNSLQDEVTVGQLLTALTLREILFFGGLFAYDSTTVQSNKYHVAMIVLIVISGQLGVVFYSWDYLGFWEGLKLSQAMLSIAFVGYVLSFMYRLFCRDKETKLIYACFLLFIAIFKYLNIYRSKKYTYMIFTLANVAVTIIISLYQSHNYKVDMEILKATVNAKKQFVRYISHELRTPLNVVSISLNLIMDELKKSASTPLSTLNSATSSTPASHIMEILKDSSSACQAAIDTLNSLLVFDKLENGNLSLDLKCVNAWNVITNSISSFSSQARANGVEFLYDEDSFRQASIKSVMINIDINKFSQVLRNLISNALRYTPSGGKLQVFTYEITLSDSPSVTKSSSVAMKYYYQPRQRRWLKIEVHDTGPGISLENQHKLFKEAIQFKSTELMGGNASGLGLWISKSIMLLHNGDLTVYSEGIPGKGCIFTVSIPIERNEANSLNGTSAQRVVPIPVERSNTSISAHPNLDANMNYTCGILVDDSALSRKVLARYLQDSFEELIQCADGVEAVDAVQNCMEAGKHIDAIFMDSVMPNMHGLEATSLIRKMGCTVPVIGVTGNVLPEQKNEFISHGANMVLAKPVNFDELRSCLANLETMRRSNESLVLADV